MRRLTGVTGLLVLTLALSACGDSEATQQLAEAQERVAELEVQVSQMGDAIGEMDTAVQTLDSEVDRLDSENWATVVGDLKDARDEVVAAKDTAVGEVH